MQKITPCLWYNGTAEEAVNLYMSIFPHAAIKEVSRYGDAMPDMAGKVLTINFQLFGQDFIALNAGPDFQFTEAISLVIDCKDQAEVNWYWEKLTADGGEESMCGWLKDKFGVSWQVIPAALYSLINSPDPEKAQRATRAMLQMHKIDLDALQRAYDG